MNMFYFAKSRRGTVVATCLVTLGISTAAPQKPVPPARPEPIEARSIENLFRIGPDLYSGGEPRGVEGFSTLKRLGVRTIISVDGAPPNVEQARKLGIRYVHLPVGYDGIPRDQALRIVRAARTLPGPVFIHCHHGKHRGPAAVAVCAVATGNWGNDEAANWLKQAGTSPDYRGLYKAVADFQPPTPAELAKPGEKFPERVATPPLIELMIAIDARFDRLKAVREAGFKPPASQPDVDPPHEALQLTEQFKELARYAASKGKDADFVRRSEAAAKASGEFEAALRHGSPHLTDADRKKITTVFLAVGKSCTDCHARYRDVK